MVGIPIVGIHHAFGKPCDSLNILHGFGGQTAHKIELDRVFPVVKSHIAGLQKVFLGDALVDGIP